MIMRRYGFYLVFALLTFSVGSLFAIKFYWNSPKSVSTSEQKIFISFNDQKKNDFLGELRKRAIENKIQPSQNTMEFTCKDANLSAVWKYPLKNENFREDVKEIVDCSTVIQIEKLIDLNNDGIKDAIVGGKDGLVNGANNQTIWIVQKIGRNYKVLLRESAEDYEIKKTTTNSFRDIFIKHHMSCCSSYQTTYKFSKGKYRENKCQFVDYRTTGEKVVTTCAEEDARIEK
jgi:hypothetical protein